MIGVWYSLHPVVGLTRKSDGLSDTWGFADVQAAMAAIPTWIKAHNWTGPGVLPNKVLVSGHSNGGLFTWGSSTIQGLKVNRTRHMVHDYSSPRYRHCSCSHFRIFFDSRYSNLQSLRSRFLTKFLAYVPYHLWHESDPRLTAILQASLVSYRHELLTANLAGKPILQQHGDADDNVPIYHSRRMSLLISQSNWASKYVELSGKGHWFDGVMTTEALQKFYNRSLQDASSSTETLQQFTFVVPSTGNLGSRAGIVVDQLLSPDQLGKIEVTVDRASLEWWFKTSNILRFHFSTDEWDGIQPKYISIDSTPSILVQDSHWLIRQRNGSWKVSPVSRQPTFFG